MEWKEHLLLPLLDIDELSEQESTSSGRPSPSVIQEISSLLPSPIYGSPLSSFPSSTYEYRTPLISRVSLRVPIIVLLFCTQCTTPSHYGVHPFPVSQCLHPCDTSPFSPVILPSLSLPSPSLDAFSPALSFFQSWFISLISSFTISHRISRPFLVLR
ncbi:hypothetical protein PRIPAC_80357 [Pristionchus pacificus]|uniref:Uncharacterized protein n=1 Tax=Pristionchus pacificus TaxID=54126 RepID=A0A8R1V344_PRIPA|nr:hypothetical protein PRIPAC_80357 [Pristionchus pacificus]